MILLIVGYEVYIAVAFTKTAGIVGAIASFGIMSDKIKMKEKVGCKGNYKERKKAEILIYECLDKWSLYHNHFIRACDELDISKSERIQIIDL